MQLCKHLIANGSSISLRYQQNQQQDLKTKMKNKKNKQTNSNVYQLIRQRKERKSIRSTYRTKTQMLSSNFAFVVLEYFDVESDFSLDL